MPPQKKPKKPPKEESAPQVQDENVEEVDDDDLAPDADEKGDELSPELARYVTADASNIKDNVDEPDPNTPKDEEPADG